MTDQNTTWELYLFTDATESKGEESLVVGSYCDEHALNAAVRHAAQTHLPTRGIPQCLSVMRTNRKVLPELQLEMGLRDTSLLRSRYMMPTLKKEAAAFWKAVGVGP